MDFEGLQSGEITSAAFPAPPGVHWGVLLIASILVDGIVEKFLPHPYSDSLSGLLLDGWAIYFCIWLRKLDKGAVSFLWWVAIAVTGFVAELIGFSVPDYSAMRFFTAGLFMITIGIYVLAVFAIRATLLQHYNGREPLGLALNPWWTLLFSFYYFQFRLYPIAQFKNRIARGKIANAEPSLLS